MSLPFRLTDIFLLAVGFLLAWKVVQTIRARARTTKLRGPPAKSWLFGVSKDMFYGDAGDLYESWEKEHGAVYQVPAFAGSSAVVVWDPKAISHFYSLETWGYTRPPIRKRNLFALIGSGVLWVDGETHKRQRRIISPAFSNASIRKFSSIFFDSAYKVKNTWDSLISSSFSGEVIIDVELWMNRVSLDSIGVAGFSHDFGALSGKNSEIGDILDGLGSLKSTFFQELVFLLEPTFPFLQRIPNGRIGLRKRLHKTMGEVAEELLSRTRNEKRVTGNYQYSPGQSIIGTLIKAEHADPEQSLSEEEVRAQMNVLMLAGYETTSITMTWSLLELARNPDKQEKLRAELRAFSTVDPTYDQMTNGLPYLNAVVREVLRLHSPATNTTRRAMQDDIMPLSTPLTTPSGDTIDRIIIAKGTTVTVPIRSINRSETFWGPNAKQFVPERWLDDAGVTSKAKEIQGFSHLLSFADGSRACLGKGFVLAQFKAVLSVLLRNYRFALRDGPNTQIDMHWALLRRPTIAGEEGAKIPLRVSRA